MTKEKYLEYKEKCSNEIKEINSKQANSREVYIESNKPCDIGQEVLITTMYGRKIKGKAHSFSIDQNTDVYISAVKPEKGAIVYLSLMYESLKIITS